MSLQNITYYNEQTVPGVPWKRAYRIIIDNTYGEQPRITFNEEAAVVVSDEIMTKPIGSVDEILISEGESANLTSTFTILDPTTGLATEQELTYAQLQAILYSFYIHKATERDQLIPPQN